MKLTAEQINHWRVMLAITGFPFAHSIPDADIEGMAQALQERLDAERQVRQIEDAYIRAKATKAANTNKRRASLADRVMEALE